MEEIKLDTTVYLVAKLRALSRKTGKPVEEIAVALLSDQLAPSER